MCFTGLCVLQGVRWLVGLSEKGLNGILADDMGLGKTVQVMATCSEPLKHSISVAAANNIFLLGLMVFNRFLSMAVYDDVT